ncbi:MAG TPA: hypothetical protein VE131_10445, partial [Terriglobales bacterium]|nr:hypothetical protein [Terriglobales bacterium]
MNKRNGLVFLTAVILALGGAQKLSAQGLDIDAAKKDGKVVVYGTTIPKVIQPIHAAFEKRYGIRVEYWRASATAVVDRAITEWRAGTPGFDVVFGINGTVSLLKRENALARYTPPAAEKFPDRVRDKDGMLTAFRHTPLA